jgi:hypothetical protein
MDDPVRDCDEWLRGAGAVFFGRVEFFLVPDVAETGDSTVYSGKSSEPPRQ